MKRLLTIFIIFGGIITSNVAHAQELQKQQIEKIKNKSSIYKWGEGTALNKEEANTEAINGLISQIKVSASGNSRNDWSNDSSGNGYDKWTGSVSITSSATLQNLEEISYLENDKWHVFRFISNEDLKAAIEQRIESERDFIYQGIEQEKQLNISGALKYYNWALSMINYYGDFFKIDINGESVIAGNWLPNKISSVLNNLKFSINESKIEENPKDYDRYSVVVNATYAGKPVSALDIKYFNGERNYTVHAKNGELALSFPDLESISKLDLSVLYSYHKEARESGGNSDLRAAYTASEGAYNNVTLAAHSLPIKYNKGKIKHTVETIANSATVAASSTTAPILGTERKTIDRITLENGQAYINAMQKVEQALRTKQYSSVRHLFTDEGYEIFSLMTKKANISVISTPNFSVEKSELFTLGKGIPVSVKTGKHISKENIVFRFEQGGPLIKSVAYAMTQKAEDDIFRQANWSLESRYSLLTFMEDYQTAFALQRLDYIKRIFSDDAVIITGKVNNAKISKTRFFEGTALNMDLKKNVSFTRQTKEQYISNLERMFKNNDWTHIEFEENVISKSPTGGLLDHEIMWIEIRQNWTSASGYNDTGFLGLQINLKPSGSQINVRTWAPEFIDIETLKKKFPTDIEL